ncbi:MAG: response regulator transcription factor [Chloroflexales bacterium]|nr:response regulator transcription factor [Chloroflexales bacterium]
MTTAGAPIKVLLVDDHEVVRVGMRALLSVQPHIELVGEAVNAAQALALLETTPPDIILLDIDLGNESGLDLLPILQARIPDARVILLTGLRDTVIHRRAVRAGAMGLVLKDKPIDVVVKAIEKVYEGEVWLDRRLIADVLSLTNGDHPAVDVELRRIRALTEREREVITLLGEGIKNRQIAERLSISEATVRHHLTSVFSKLGVTDRFELVIFAYRHGLAQMPEG